jgi:hypothetical protein
MEIFTGSENFGPSHYDYDFDFEIDLHFTPVEYFLIGCYLVFVMPFEIIGRLLPERFHFYRHYLERKKSATFSPGLNPALARGPYCPWPRTIG